MIRLLTPRKAAGDALADRLNMPHPTAFLIIAFMLLTRTLLPAQGASERFRWFFFMEKTQVQSPALSPEGTIYIGTGLGETSLPSDGVYAVNPDGTQKWKMTLGKSVHSSVALDRNGNLYLIVGDANNPDRMNAALYSLDALGRLRWIFENIGWMAPVPNTGFTPAIAEDGTLYVCGLYSLFAVDSIGRMKWKYDFPLIDHVNSSGVIQTTGSNRSAPTVAKDGTIYVNTKKGWHGGIEAEGGIFAFDPDGNLEWRTYDVGGCAAPIIGEDGTVYAAIGRYENAADTSDWTAASREAKLLAIHPDGTPKWSVTTLLWIQASPSIGADGTLYAGTSHHPLNKPGWVYAITPEGRIRWKYDTYDDVKDMPQAQQNAPDIYNSPLVDSNGLIYFGNEIGLFYALTPEGKQAWIENVSSLLYSSPALADDGTLYVASHEKIALDHYGLIALNTGSHGLADSPWPKFRQNNANTGNALPSEQPGSAGHAGMPGIFDLYPNCPNSFNSETVIPYSLSASSETQLMIVDVSGRPVTTLVDEWRLPGSYRAVFDGRELPSGVYFCHLRAGAQKKTIKILMVK